MITPYIPIWVRVCEKCTYKMGSEQNNNHCLDVSLPNSFSWHHIIHTVMISLQQVQWKQTQKGKRMNEYIQKIDMNYRT